MTEGIARLWRQLGIPKPCKAARVRMVRGWIRTAPFLPSWKMETPRVPAAMGAEGCEWASVLRSSAVAQRERSRSK